jgi:hypothetical protein
MDAPQATAPTDPLTITLGEYTAFLEEIEEQPRWRSTADKEMDYADGNQLDSELLKRQAELGIPPAVEDLIGPALLSIQGYEATIRTDWRVTPDGGTGGQDVADALNYRLNQAERHSKADRACSDAFRPQIGVGIGFVEVKRERDPTKYPYRCIAVHRNEIHWDVTGQESDLSDARFMRRQRWLSPERVALVFPKHKELINHIGKSGASWWGDVSFELADGGGSTGLRNSWDESRAWTVAEDRWYNRSRRDVCLVEFWYRRWVEMALIKTPDGRAVEYDKTNMAHNVALASGRAKFSKSIVARLRRSYWLGPHLLDDAPSPYIHTHFPYVPFWGFKEDGTGVPYGYIRGMIYPQDSLNSGISKLRWGMSAVQTVRTKGATDMTDAQVRRQVSRVDSDIVLNAQAMTQQGARFEVTRNFQLNDQQHQLINDNRTSIQRVSAVTNGFMGKQGTATSGLQEQTQVEQSNQSLARPMDNFREGRSMVGELLMSMIVEDMGSEEQTVIIEGDAVKEDRSVVINRPEVDEYGIAYLSNDLQRTRLKVALEDVPSSASYRGQQLNAMSEAVKSLPAQYQAAMLPFMVSLMDVPFKKAVVEAIRAAAEQESPEAIEKRIQQAVQDALAKSGIEVKMREVAIKEGKSEAEIRKLMAEAVQIGVQSAYSAMQGGAQIAQMPQIAPIADSIMQSSGYQNPAPGGVDPNYPQPQAMAQQQAPQVQANTSPAFPPVPQQGGSSMQGIETPTVTDNIGAA